MSIKQKVIDGIIDREGGYVDDQDDSGGETRWGITKKVAKRYGYRGDMRDLPRETAFDIYDQRYWQAMRLGKIEKISPKIAEEIADTGVNMGVARAGDFLQRSLNALNNRGAHFKDLHVDGVIGRRTLKALSKHIKKRPKNGVTVLLRMLNSLQGAFYISLAERREKDEKFIYGWFLNRVIGV